MNYQSDFLKFKPTGVALETGSMLISTPFYNDGNFNHSVVLLLDYDEKGAAGLILNKVTPYSIRRAKPSWRIDDEISFGGPVLGDEIFTLHSFADPEKYAPVKDGLYAGIDHVLLSLIEHKAIPDLKYRFFIGYSGWSAGQLDDEVAQGMWAVSEYQPALVFDMPADEVWPTAVRHLGPDYQHWLNFPKYLIYN